jgi:hypothetical protein
MEESNRKKTSRRNHPSTRLADDKPINGMRLYIEEMDIYGNLENPHDDDDLSSIEADMLIREFAFWKMLTAGKKG